MSDKYIKALRRMARDGIMTPGAAENLLHAHANDADWREELHPRGEGGKFAKKGTGKTSGGESQSGSGSFTAPQIQPPERASHPRKPEKGTGIAGQIRAARITKAGEASENHKVAKMDSASRFAPKPGEMHEGPKFAEGSAFNKPKTGRPSKELTKGTGATKLSVGDLYNDKKPDARHTVNQYLDDNGNLTPEREELHAQAVENLFAGKQPVAPGERRLSQCSAEDPQPEKAA